MSRTTRKRKNRKKHKANTLKICRCEMCRAGRRSDGLPKELNKKIRRNGIENVKLGGYTD